jgi:hypothetical protein
MRRRRRRRDRPGAAPPLPRDATERLDQGRVAAVRGVFAQATGLRSRSSRGPRKLVVRDRQLVRFRRRVTATPYTLNEAMGQHDAVTAHVMRKVIRPKPNVVRMVTAIRKVLGTKPARYRVSGCRGKHNRRLIQILNEQGLVRRLPIRVYKVTHVRVNRVVLRSGTPEAVPTVVPGGRSLLRTHRVTTGKKRPRVVRSPEMAPDRGGHEGVTHASPNTSSWSSRTSI